MVMSDEICHEFPPAVFRMRLECQMEAALVKVLVGICISLGFVCSLFSSLAAEFLGGSPCLTNATRSIGQFQMGLGEKEACRGSSSAYAQQDEKFAHSHVDAQLHHVWNICSPFPKSQ